MNKEAFNKTRKILTLGYVTFKFLLENFKIHMMNYYHFRI